MVNRYLSYAVGPGTELQGTCLLIKREVGDINVTATLKVSWRLPGHSPITVYCNLGVCGHLILAICTARLGYDLQEMILVVK